MATANPSVPTMMTTATATKRKRSTAAMEVNLGSALTCMIQGYFCMSIKPAIKAGLRGLSSKVCKFF